MPDIAASFHCCARCPRFGLKEGAWIWVTRVGFKPFPRTGCVPNAERKRSREIDGFGPIKARREPAFHACIPGVSTITWIWDHFPFPAPADFRLFPSAKRHSGRLSIPILTQGVVPMYPTVDPLASYRHFAPQLLPFRRRSIRAGQPAHPHRSPSRISPSGPNSPTPTKASTSMPTKTPWVRRDAARQAMIEIIPRGGRYLFSDGRGAHPRSSPSRKA